MAIGGQVTEQLQCIAVRAKEGCARQFVQGGLTVSELMVVDYEWVREKKFSS